MIQFKKPDSKIGITEETRPSQAPENPNNYLENIELLAAIPSKVVGAELAER